MATRVEIRGVRPVVNGDLVNGDRVDRPLTGQDIRVVLVDDSNHAVLVPALSLVLHVGGRHEQAIATIEVPAHLVDLEGVVLRAEAVVASGGPESQWEESLGKRPGERVADADEYSENPHVVVGEAEPPEFLRERLGLPPTFPVQTFKSDPNLLWKDIATSTAAIQHAPYCHATIPTPDRPTGGCVCGVFVSPRHLVEEETPEGEIVRRTEPDDPMAELDAVIAAGGSIEKLAPRGPESTFEAESMPSVRGEDP